jgi:vacuolar-type H+-ATPase catalytic subunit A/Vma1
MNTAKTITQKYSTANMEPVLRKVLKEAEQEHEELQEMFRLMGWEALPDALKIEIKDDVSAMVDELQGNYSSCDPHVARRRRRVIHWVNSFLDDICSLETAIEALRVRRL